MQARKESRTITAGLLMAALVFAATASAATFEVTRTDDPAPDGCDPGDCSLREAVLDANAAAGADLILLDPGTYVVSLDGSDTDDTGDIDIRSDLTIRGPATIDGQGQGRIFEIRDASMVTLDDLVLQNSATSLASNGTVNGGAVQIDGGRLTIRSALIRDNSAQGQGAGVFTRDDAVLVVEDSVFTGNRSANGAAIYANGDVTVRNTRFEDNQAEQRGAALYLAGTESDVELERVSLIDNRSGGSGGGAVLFLGRELDIHDLLAAGNQCLDGNGGVLAITGTAHGKAVRISSAVFSGNAAENGGALSLADDEDPVTLSQIAFVDNSASRQGGALYTTGGAIDIANVTFSGNEAGTDGGAIHLFGMSLLLRQVTITGGAANRGSALSVNGSSAISLATLANSIIDGDCRISNADTLISEGGNLESPGDSCALSDPSDQVDLAPASLGLLPRQPIAGATPSHPLSAASAARGAGLAEVCAALPSDQLFRPRPSPCSAGAVDDDFLFADGYEALRPLGSDGAMSR